MIERLELTRGDFSQAANSSGSVTQDKPRTDVVESKVTTNPVDANINETENATGQSVQEKIAEDLKKIIESKESLSSLQNRELDFSFQEELGRVVVQVLDKETNEVIRQIPSEEFARVAKKIDDLHQQLNSLQGLLFESKT
jgi:flagellar protein FlaG